MTTLFDVSNTLAAAVEAAAASLVRVDGRRRQAATGVVWSADGLIVTAHHVVERDDSVRVTLPDGTTHAGQVVGRDPSTDVAIVRVNAAGLTPAVWTDGAAVKVGQIVLALGRPEGHPQAALGTIHAVGGAWRTMAGGTIDAFIQSDLVMYPGFSGGPLLSADGSFVGINSSALARGMSLTIPAATLRRVADALLTHGRVRRGYLGVSAQAVRLPAALIDEAGQETGLLLVGVEPGSPAEHGGLLLGDVIVMLGGERVRHMDDLMAALSGDRVGTAIPARVVRGGQFVDLSVTVGDRA